MERIIVCNQFVNVFTMQVCTKKNATDAEILTECNLINPSGTRAGWTTVIRALGQSISISREQLPTQCEKYPDRIHFLVIC